MSQHIPDMPQPSSQPQWQQSPYHYPQQTPQYPLPQPPMQQPKTRKPMGGGTKLGCGAVIALVALITILIIAVAANGGTSSTTTPNTQPATQNQTTPAPTDVPTPALSPAQQEATYKASTTNTTVSTIDKDGNVDQGNDVHFTSTILNFVKDTSGNTAGANISDANSTSIIQVLFTPGTDITQLNQGDTLEVWGNDQGVSSGSNAFGATVQETVVQANYMIDQTTSYKADS